MPLADDAMSVRVHLADSHNKNWCSAPGTLSFFVCAMSAWGVTSVNNPNRLLWSYEICRLAKSRVDHPPHGVTLCGELVAVAVAQVDRDPVVRDRLV